MADKRPLYDGEYSVVSRIDGDVRLPTAGTKLTRNIVIKTIPYSETTNLSGGVTVYIGKED